VSENLTVVETIFDLTQAEILRGLLEASGIRVLVSYESAGRAIGLSVGRLGQVDILVPVSQADEARQILGDYYAGRLEGE
jgi:hypothetical protein